MNDHGEPAYPLGELVAAMLGELRRRVELEELSEELVAGVSVAEVLEGLVIGAGQTGADVKRPTPTERLRGRYFVFSHVPHLVEWELRTVASLAEAEGMLEMMLNPFEGGMFVLDGLKPCPYELWCDHGNGHLEPFSKRAQSMQSDPFGRPAPLRVEVRWLAAPDA